MICCLIIRNDGPDKLCIVLEFAGRGTLQDILEEEDTSWNYPVRQMLEGLVSCLKYLHSLDPVVIHRDIKPENTLADITYQAKLADFGASRHFEAVNDSRGVETMTRVGK